MPSLNKHSGITAVLFLFVITACGFTSSQIEGTGTPSEEPVVTQTTVPEPSMLTVCLGFEPNTLYPYGGPNAAARSVLAAVYDGPLDMIGYDYQPVILIHLPTIENGEAQIVSTPVQSGDQIVDADGNLVPFEKGVHVHPTGCRADDCVITYDGTTDLEMDQMIVDFHMRADLTWADGTPITSDDSVYAFTLASDPSAVTNKYLTDRTQTYESTDTQTVQWWGKPGFIDPAYVTNFWAPAPQHLWAEFPVNQLQTIDIASRSPMGWGAYAIDDWVANDHITLTKNPYYFRAVDGYPKFDILTFRFIDDPNTALSELVAGRCDILDPTVNLDGQAGLLQEMQAGEQLQAYFAPGMTIEWLGLGIAPASYDDGYDVINKKDRQDFFADAHTRQGIAYCLDRQSVVNNVLFGFSSVPTTYLPVEHPLFDADIEAIPYNPGVGLSLLEQSGWRDTDGDPSTPLRAVNVSNVTAGTQLQLDYYTTTATQRRQVVEILQRSLAQCGIGLNLEYFPQNDLYAPGPQGFLFGRRFDLIEYALGVNGFEPPCGWFTSNEIPTEANAWIGTNVTGYRNTEFDAACRAARLALPDEPDYIDAYRNTQVIFSNELPAIPLYYRLRIAAARTVVCNFDLDPTANPLWNIEAIEIGEACRK
ncbi:MAG TPA: ABC transporter substrate-binding protein [Anaerolineales bacterium]|nr:ABC transporter substrate-binding protein [Anaerolineales bacterium]